MEKDIHYYMTYVLAKVTGMSNPETIAHASQFVDDNNEGQFSVDGESISFPEKLEAGGGYYYPIMTQSLSPKSLDPYVQKYVYVPFHFLPGDNTVTIKSEKNPLSTTPDSVNAKALLTKALESDDPYLVGIGIHSYMDTWSHQNFSGMREEWNAVYPWYNLFKSLVPNIGHAEAGHHPDIVSEVWTDYRLGSGQIDNRVRVMEAAKAVFGHLRDRMGTSLAWPDVETPLAEIVYTPDYDARIRKMGGFLTDRGEGPIPDYSKDDWIDGALDKGSNDDGKVIMKPGFTATDWYRFHQAAKVHFATVIGMISPLI